MDLAKKLLKRSPDSEAVTAALVMRILNMTSSCWLVEAFDSQPFSQRNYLRQNLGICGHSGMPLATRHVLNVSHCGAWWARSAYKIRS